MCGRFTITVSLGDLCERFMLEQILIEYMPRFNIAPGQTVPVVIKKGGIQLVPMKWGLIPFWAKDSSIGNKMFNARGETLTEKPSFARSLQGKRCIIPADGFYEWKREGKTKRPFRITLNDGSVFGFAGLYDRWTSAKGEEIISFTIITTTPNKKMAQIHSRMPAILPQEAESTWLDPDQTDKKLLTSFIRPYPAEQMTLYEVSPLVNSPANDRPDCINCV